MKGKVITSVVGILLGTLACGIIAPLQAPTQAGEVPVAEATATNVPPPTEALQPGGITISFQNVSLVIPSGTATGADAGLAEVQTEEDAPPFMVAPEHIVFSFRGWPKPNTNQLIPSVMVYPAQEYAAMYEGAAKSLARLKTILTDPALSINLDTAPFAPDLPFDQLIVAQPARLDFAGGSGIRMINFYAALPLAVTDQGQVYHYQGLTGDGKYYVIAVLPLVSPLLSTSDNPSADGVMYPGVDASEEVTRNYYQAMTDKLNAAGPESFTPTLSQLDALIQSITITSQ